MALSRVKTWGAEVLTYADLNAEFNNILNNPVSLISPLTAALDLDGQTITLDAAGATTFVSSSGVSWNFTSGAKSGTPATTGSIVNLSAQTFTDSATAGSGTAAAYTAFAIQRPTLAATNASVTTTDAAVWYIPNNVAAGSNETITNSWSIWVDAGNVRFDDDIHWLSGQTFAQRGILAHANTGVRTYTFQDASGTVAFTSDISLAATIVDAAGDLIVGTAADTVARKAVGTAGTVLMSRAAETDKLAYVAALNKAIYGLTYDNGTDATNDININTGGAMDATGAYWMTLATALGKQSDVAWAVGGTTGAPAGWLDTGAVGNSDYYIWLIARSDTGVVDSLCSLSSTAPTMPTNYDFKRLIGWFKRVGGTIVAFTTYETEGGGIELAWNAPTLDVDLSNTLTTSRRTDAAKVPLNFSVIAQLSFYIADVTSTAVNWVGCPDVTDTAPSVTAALLANAETVTAKGVSTQLSLRTSAAGLIAARSTLSTVDSYRFTTMGFRWGRRN